MTITEELKTAHDEFFSGMDSVESLCPSNMPRLEFIMLEIIAQHIEAIEVRLAKIEEAA